MTITLITGANKGIGFETARRLIAAGHTVWLGAARHPSAEPGAPTELGATFVQLDVTDDARSPPPKTVRPWGSLDVLVNNAGITDYRGLRAAPT